MLWLGLLCAHGLKFTVYTADPGSGATGVTLQMPGAAPTCLLSKLITNATLLCAFLHYVLADDYAPPAQKARWFATFYLCIPVGFAAGYIYGGLVSAALGWRSAFIIESLAVLPFVVFMFVSKPLHLAGSRDKGPGEVVGYHSVYQMNVLCCI